MRKLSLNIFLLGFPFVALAQVTHLDTLRHLDVQPLGSYSAIWGYTAPNGREYALIGVNGGASYPGGTSIIDITNISNVRQVAFIGGPNSGWREMKTYMQYAYIVSEASNAGVQIVDLSQLPDTATLIRTFNYTSGTKNILRNHTISIHDGFMYLNGSANWSPGGMIIFDLRSNPTNPQYVGEYQPEYIHDSYVLRDTIYGAAINSGGGLYIADARNKANIQVIGKITYSGSGTHNAWVTKDRRYVITTDEIGTTAKNLKVWNIGNLPTIPTTTTATFTPVPTQIVHNVTIRGDYAYVAWYSAGVRVVNISNPAVPTDAGGYDTSPSTSGFNGVWGIYPYFPSGKIIASDMQNGLWVFSFSDLAPRVPVNLLQPANGDTVGNQSPLTFRWSKSANLSKDPHYYEVRIMGSGVDTTVRANDSVLTFNNVAALQEGQAYSWYVVTRDEWNTTMSLDTATFIIEGGTATATIVVVAPNGGEIWQYSTSHNITWTSNLVDTVNISYKVSPGSPWVSVADNIAASSGLYSWTLPNAQTTQARVRVVDKLNGAVLDSSNGVFSITVPMITASPDSVAFGTVNVGTTKKDTIRIHNTGTAPLTVSSVSIDSAAFGVSRTSLVIAAGSSDTLTIAFSPTQVRPYTASLTLASNAPTTPTRVALTGTGHPTVSVGENGIPTEFVLRQNYPNPFNPNTTISYDIPVTSVVTLKVYNLIGQRVAELVNEVKEPGRYQVSFETTNLASGVYFYRLSAGSFTDTKRMVLVR